MTNECRTIFTEFSKQKNTEINSKTLKYFLTQIFLVTLVHHGYQRKLENGVTQIKKYNMMNHIPNILNVSKISWSPSTLTGIDLLWYFLDISNTSYLSPNLYFALTDSNAANQISLFKLITTNVDRKSFLVLTSYITCIISQKGHDLLWGD